MSRTEGSFTLVFNGAYLIATVPRGADLAAAVKEEERRAGAEFDSLSYVYEVTLTNYPKATDRIVFTSNGLGWLMSGSETFRYAVVPRTEEI